MTRPRTTLRGDMRAQAGTDGLRSKAYGIIAMGIAVVVYSQLPKPALDVFGLAAIILVVSVVGMMMFLLMYGPSAYSGVEESQ